MEKVHPQVRRDRLKRAGIVVGLLVYFCCTYWLVLHARDQRPDPPAVYDPLHR